MSEEALATLTITEAEFREIRRKRFALEDGRGKGDEEAMIAWMNERFGVKAPGYRLRVWERR